MSGNKVIRGTWIWEAREELITGEPLFTSYRNSVLWPQRAFDGRVKMTLNEVSYRYGFYKNRLVK